jgi:tripartite-type tricarboxylate transporter receptor subunit TctC
MTATFGIYGPANMPADRVSKLSEAFLQALSNSDLVASLASAGTEVQAQTAAQLKAFTVAEYERYKALVAVSGAKVD